MNEEAVLELNTKMNGLQIMAKSNFNENNKSFYLTFKSGFGDVNFYNLFFTDIINEANKVYSKQIIELCLFCIDCFSGWLFLLE